MKMLKNRINIIPEQKINIFEVGDRLVVEQISHVQEVDDSLYIWYLSGSGPERIVKLRMFFTGEELPDNPGKYIGTQILGNGLVVHLFAEE